MDWPASIGDVNLLVVILTGLASLLGLLVGAALTYVVQTTLAKDKRREAERRLAAACLAQTNQFLAAHATFAAYMQVAIPQIYTPEDERLAAAFKRGDCGPQEFWSLAIERLVSDETKATETLNRSRPLLDLSQSYLSKATASLSLSLRDMGTLPLEIVVLLHRTSAAAQTFESTLRAVMNAANAGHWVSLNATLIATLLQAYDRLIKTLALLRGALIRNLGTDGGSEEELQDQTTLVLDSIAAAARLKKARELLAEFDRDDATQNPSTPHA